jgi:hypothetical protein
MIQHLLLATKGNGDDGGGKALVAVIAGLLAALGYVGKQILGFVLEQQRKAAEQRARLIELRSLLNASRATYLAQVHLRNRLWDSLAANHKEKMAALLGGPLVQPNRPVGYERAFTALYPDFSPAEKELHGLMRGMTEHSLRPLNQATGEWLQKDHHYKVAGRSQGPRQRLALGLIQLEAHLTMWLAKYQAWIPGREDHALVYLADEEETGHGFPRGIEADVEELVVGKSSAAPVSLPNRQND